MIRGWLRTPYVWLVLVAAAGIAMRLWLAAAIYPMTGDPVYSYAYRAFLIAHGDWGGVRLMWHPPGYPLLLAGLTWLGRGLLSPYAWGVVLGSASCVGLILLVDALIAPRVQWPLTRLVAATFVAFYEGLLMIGAAPLTEAVYLTAVMGGVVLLDRDASPVRTPLLAGLAIGVAATTRLEGFAVSAGLGVYLLLRSPGPRANWRPASAFGLGFLTAAGWLLLQGEYLNRMLAAPAGAVTVSAAATFPGQLRRLMEVSYTAAVVWLPYTVLLPYWLFVAWGVLPSRQPHRRGVTPLLLAAILPNLLAVGLTIMHKRTGSFLLPAVAVWTALGVERLVHELGAAHRPLWRGAILSSGIALNLTQAGRVPYHLGRAEAPSAAYVQSKLLSGAGAEPACTWAFGGEPEVYYFASFLIRYPFYDRDRAYNGIYRDHRGDPQGFVDALRNASFDYLAFVLPDSLRSGADSTEGAPQPYERYSGRPLLRDLRRLTQLPSAFGLEPLGQPVPMGPETVYGYRLRADDRGRAHAADGVCRVESGLR